MRVGNDRAGAVRHSDPREFAHPQLRAFKVDMRVNEGGRQVATFEVEHLACASVAPGVRAQPRNPPTADGDRNLLNRAREDVDDAAAALAPLQSVRALRQTPVMSGSCQRDADQRYSSLRHSSLNMASSAAVLRSLTGTPSMTVSGAAPPRRTSSSTAAGSCEMSFSMKGIPQA